MRASRSVCRILIAAAVLASAAAAPPAAAEEPALAELLFGLEREFDRHGLPAETEYVHADGRLGPGVRCATRPVADVERALIAAAVDQRLAVTGTAHRRRAIEIPVAFHVLRKANGKWDVDDDRIDQQIELLNASFAGTGFSFVLERVERHDRNRFAKKCLSDNVEQKFKKRYAVDPARTLNIYTCRPTQDVLGYAYFPSDFPEDSILHGVVALHSSVAGGTAEPYHLGDTVVHEVGHYLGLFHTFEGKCGGRGDRVADTPDEKKPAYGCPLGRDTCPTAGADPVTNFMNYGDDLCVDEFTQDQATRMQDQVATFKPSL